jgi:hypothetical protein
MRRAAAAMLSLSAADRPVVPTTSRAPAAAAAWALATEDTGAVKSIQTSACPAAGRSADSATPSAPSPARVPASAPSSAAPARSTAATRRACG